MDSPDHRRPTKQTISVPRPEDSSRGKPVCDQRDLGLIVPKDRNFKNVDTLIRSLIEIISRAVIFLLDVGPQPDETDPARICGTP